MRSGIATCFALTLGIVSVAAGQTKSPIFGTATVAPTTSSENKLIVGKGYYADYYGSAGLSNLNYSAAYVNSGDYTSAAYYAYYAYYNLYTASYLQQNGY
jgi:hypothetical protein